MRIEGTLSQEHGFTLIELVLSLCILGLIGAMGAMGFTDAVRGYLHGVDNSNIAGKAQVALDRLTLEITHIDFWDENNEVARTGVSSSDRSTLTYAVDFGTNKAQSTGNVIAYSQDEKTVSFNGNVLVDDVTNFSLDYFSSPTETSPSADSSYVSGTTESIGITLELTGVNGVPITFTTRVVPMFNQRT